MNKRVAESLVLAGAFDELDISTEVSILILIWQEEPIWKTDPIRTKLSGK
jgi:hypothetical protein